VCFDTSADADEAGPAALVRPAMAVVGDLEVEPVIVAADVTVACRAWLCLAMLVSVSAATK